MRTSNVIHETSVSPTILQKIEYLKIEDNKDLEEMKLDEVAKNEIIEERNSHSESEQVDGDGDEDEDNDPSKSIEEKQTNESDKNGSKTSLFCKIIPSLLSLFRLR